MEAQKYLITIEPTKTGFSAYSPDLQGCVTVGETVEQTRENMEEAIELYLEELTESGENIRVPRKLIEQVSMIGDCAYKSKMAFPSHDLSRLCLI